MGLPSELRRTITNHVYDSTHSFGHQRVENDVNPFRAFYELPSGRSRATSTGTTTATRSKPSTIRSTTECHTSLPTERSLTGIVRRRIRISPEELLGMVAARRRSLCSQPCSQLRRPSCAAQLYQIFLFSARRGRGRAS